MRRFSPDILIVLFLAVAGLGTSAWNAVQAEIAEHRHSRTRLIAPVVEAAAPQRVRPQFFARPRQEARVVQRYVPEQQLVIVEEVRGWDAVEDSSEFYATPNRHCR